MTNTSAPQAMPDELYVTTAAGLVEGAYRDKATLRRDWQRMWPEYTETELDAIMTAPEEQSEIYHVRQVRETRNGAIYQSRDGQFFRVYNDWDKFGAASGGIVRPDELATAGNAFYIWFTEHTAADCQGELDRVRIADELAIPMAYDNGVHLTNYLDGQSFQTMEEAEAAVKAHFKIYGVNPYQSFDARVLKEFYVRKR